MFDHLSFKVQDFQRSLRFYTATLESIGYRPQGVDEAGQSAAFGPPGDAVLYLSQGGPRAPLHLAFKGATRAAVDGFHAAALKAGGTDHGKPGLRLDYSKDYYAAFVLDPDGNNLEVVTRSAR